MGSCRGLAVGIWMFLGAMAIAVPMAGGDQCGDEVQSLVNNCAPILFGLSPSAACCDLIRSADMSCVCPKVTPQIAARINVPKVVRVIEGCGRNVPHNTRCGSIVTP